MKRATLISLIDVITFIAFLFLTSSGILLHYVLPPGSGRWSEIWGMSRHQWGELHFWIAVLFFSVLLFHLTQHWRFVLGLFRGHLQECLRLRVALGLVGLLSLILLAIAPLIAPVQIDDGRGIRPYRGQGQRCTSLNKPSKRPTCRLGSHRPVNACSSGNHCHPHPDPGSIQLVWSA